MVQFNIIPFGCYKWLNFSESLKALLFKNILCNFGSYIKKYRINVSVCKPKGFRKAIYAFKRRNFKQLLCRIGRYKIVNFLDKF